ncbi:hypothetical protein ACWDKQ_07465 [Saccharopolyspora sp. NPDC000995]
MRDPVAQGVNPVDNRVHFAADPGRVRERVAQGGPPQGGVVVATLAERLLANKAASFQQVHPEPHRQLRDQATGWAVRAASPVGPRFGDRSLSAFVEQLLVRPPPLPVSLGEPVVHGVAQHHLGHIEIAMKARREVTTE